MAGSVNRARAVGLFAAACWASVVAGCWLMDGTAVLDDYWPMGHRLGGLVVAVGFVAGAFASDRWLRAVK